MWLTQSIALILCFTHGCCIAASTPHGSAVADNELDAAFADLTQQKYDAALSVYKRAAEGAPEDPNLLNSIGFIFIAKNDCKLALQKFEEARLQASGFKVPEYTLLTVLPGSRQSFIIFPRYGMLTTSLPRLNKPRPRDTTPWFVPAGKSIALHVSYFTTDAFELSKYMDSVSLIRFIEKNISAAKDFCAKNPP